MLGTGPWASVRGAYVASIEELGVRDLGRMLSGNEVDDCQSDKVGLSYGGGDEEAILVGAQLRLVGGRRYGVVGGSWLVHRVVVRPKVCRGRRRRRP